MIEAHDLSRRYGDFTAVDRISFAVGDGEILGILGPNGAGKTTTIRMITGFLPPTSGKVTVAGKDLADDAGAARRDIGYLPENVALYPEMRVTQYLEYRARLEGLNRSTARAAIADTLDRCLLDTVQHQVIGTLSKGYRQRVGLAAAILHEPRVLVLDEPTVGLDPKQIIAIRELIRELGRSRTLLLSTHILPEVELLCDRLVIIDRGRIIDQGSPASLRERWSGGHEVRVGFEGAPAEAAEVLERVTGVTAVRPHSSVPGTFLLQCESLADPRASIFRLAVERGWVMIELVEQRASLEDVFVRLTTRDAAADEPTDDSEQATDGGPASEEVPS